MVCCSSSCAALFDFLCSCGVHLIHIEDRLFNQRVGRQRCWSGGMDVPVTLILSYIFVGIMPLYAINLDVVSLFADSSFTFLAVLNDVISRFEWISFCFCQKKKVFNWHFTPLEWNYLGTIQPDKQKSVINLGWWLLCTCTLSFT